MWRPNVSSRANLLAMAAFYLQAARLGPEKRHGRQDKDGIRQTLSVRVAQILGRTTARRNPRGDQDHAACTTPPRKPATQERTNT